MIYLNVRHTAADYAKWRVGFDAHETARRAAGATGVQHVPRLGEPQRRHDHYGMG